MVYPPLKDLKVFGNFLPHYGLYICLVFGGGFSSGGRAGGMRFMGVRQLKLFKERLKYRLV